MAVLWSRAPQLICGWRQFPSGRSLWDVQMEGRALGTGKDAEKPQKFTLNELDCWVIHQDEWWAGD